jgi:hypothetical protein
MDRELDKAATGPRWLLDERCAAGYGEQPLGLYDLRAWVLMVNHVHILIDPRAELSRITKAVKNFSARKPTRFSGAPASRFGRMNPTITGCGAPLY